MAGNKISVVIPTLNEEENIVECLNCLIKQIEKPYEVIVVDNGSSDKTLKKVDSLKNKFNKNNIILQSFYYNVGNQTNARDFGVRKANGNIIASLDAEANADQHWIKNINKYFENSEIVGIAGKSSFRNTTKFFNLVYHLNYYWRIALKELFNSINFFYIGGGNCAFRKDVFLKIKGYSGLEKLRKEKNILYAKDDYYLTKKLEKHGKIKFYHDVNVTLLYRIRDKTNKEYLSTTTLIDNLKRAALEMKYDFIISMYFFRHNK